MSESLVLVDVENPAVAIITLNRPAKRNAMSLELMGQLRAAIDGATSDVRRRVMILRGNGAVFCAGLDLREVSSGEGAEASAHALAGLYGALAICPLITIAAAHGGVIGGGIGLMGGCDLAIAAEDVQIGFPEVKLGLVAALIAPMVRRQVGDRALREVMLLGETIDAKRALAMGLINQIVTREKLMNTVLELAARAAQGAPRAVARAKKLLDELPARTIGEELQLALKHHVQARYSPEAAEGIAAFFEKRPPRWIP